MPKAKQPKVVIAGYIPVLHRGYIQLFNKFKNAAEVYVFDEELLKKEDYLRKDLRALKPSEAVSILKATGRFKTVKLLNKHNVARLDLLNIQVVMPDEDISRLVSKRFKKAKVVYYPVFLRWDRRSLSSKNKVNPDRTISRAAFDQKVMKLAQSESTKSSNIWRRVGAVVIKDGKVLFKSSNRHLPTDYSLWIDGDPRGISRQGADVELTTDMHAEAKVIAEAAKKGQSLKGASIYVSTFPCPPCSKLIAESGISTCFYSGGYAMLDGETILKANKVKLVQVAGPENDGHENSWVPYKK